VQICGKRLVALAANPFPVSRVSHIFAPQPQQPPVFAEKKKEAQKLLALFAARDRRLWRRL
jgi:hypothetical protein